MKQESANVADHGLGLSRVIVSPSSSVSSLHDKEGWTIFSMLTMDG